MAESWKYQMNKSNDQNYHVELKYQYNKMNWQGDNQEKKLEGSFLDNNVIYIQMKKRSTQGWKIINRV